MESVTKSYRDDLLGMSLNKSMGSIEDLEKNLMALVEKNKKYLKEPFCSSCDDSGMATRLNNDGIRVYVGRCICIKNKNFIKERESKFALFSSVLGRYKATDWLDHQKRFMKGWAADGRSSFWLHGAAGNGKSEVMHFVLREKYKANWKVVRGPKTSDLFRVQLEDASYLRKNFNPENFDGIAINDFDKEPFSEAIQRDVYDLLDKIYTLHDLGVKYPFLVTANSSITEFVKGFTGVNTDALLRRLKEIFYEHGV